MTLTIEPIYNIVVCAIVKNEFSYLLEWIAYHRTIGVDSFLIYNNDSTDKTLSLLKKLANAKILNFVDWPSQPNGNNQRRAYRDAVSQLKNKSEWVAFIDLDEFIVLHKYLNIKEFLLEHHHVSGIAMNWKIFGSSGYLKKTNDLIIERFTKCSSSKFRRGENFPNCKFKTIAKVDRIKNVRVHSCEFLSAEDLYIYPDGTLKDLNSFENGTHISHDILQINHYIIKSKEEFDLKRARGIASKKMNDPGRIRDESFFNLNDRNEEEDLSIQKFLQQTKEEISYLKSQL